MKKIIFTLVILLSALLSASAQNATGGFPFYRSFLDGIMDAVEKAEPNPGGSVDRSNKATLVEDLGLQLTTGKSQVGAFYIPSHPFTLTLEDGLLIEFEYMMYPTNPAEDGITDGLCMFLVDAAYASATVPLKYGSEGAGFGYAYRFANNYINTERVMGIRRAYMAVALDQRNFKVRRMEEYAQRNGIYFNDNPTVGDVVPTKYNTDSNVTIRGAAGQTAITIPSNGYNYARGEAFWGYPTLITRYTGGTSDANGLRNEAGLKLDTSSGYFSQYNTPAIPEPFHIASKGRFESPSEAAYRKAIILLESAGASGEFQVTVTIQHGEEKTTIIENFTYPATLTYLTNDLPTPWSIGEGQPPSSWTNPAPFTYTAAPPDELVIGFMAATGTETNYTNVIKHLRITPARGAATANDDITGHRRGPVVILPLENDLAWQGEGAAGFEHKDNIDPASFRFWSDEYTCLGTGVFEYTKAGEGKWVYDPDRAEVLFFPEKGFNTKAYLMYDIKSKYFPYTDEKFRSSLAIISVTLADNQPW